MTDDYVVYWLFDETCETPERDGYVGVTRQFAYRMRVHRRNPRFPPNFSTSIIAEGSLSECRAVEWRLRPASFIGWNLAVGGKPSVNHTDAVRAKLRAAQLGRKYSADSIEKRRNASRGRTNRGRLGQKKSLEEISKIAAAHRGMKRSADARQKMAERKRGNTNRLGKRHSEATREIIRLKKTGVPIHSDEHKRALAERMKGNAFTKGKPWSAARRLAWIERRSCHADFV